MFADAGLEDASDGVAFGIAFNTGQCCGSGSRLIIARSIADRFGTIMAQKLARVRVGDPLDAATQVGAIPTEAQYATISGYLEQGKAAGAKVATGGGAIDRGAGQYVAPTLLIGVTPDMAVARDEILGPVLVSMRFDTLDEAEALASDTSYGLAASVRSKNIDTALTAIRRIKAGRCWVNAMMAGAPEMPLGGFKQSGWGRKAGMYGVEDCTQVKSVPIAFGKPEHWVA